MKFITDLLQQDMFVAVVSYLSVGLVFLVFFYFRERKWENDLAQYQITEMAKIAENTEPRGNVYPFRRSTDYKRYLAPSQSDEMQVVEGEVIEPASNPTAAAEKTAKPN